MLFNLEAGREPEGQKVRVSIFVPCEQEGNDSKEILSARANVCVVALQKKQHSGVKPLQIYSKRSEETQLRQNKVSDLRLEHQRESISC